MSRARVFALTTFALVAFAANSVLCRLALGERAIDAASFSVIRLTSGALTLFLLSGAFERRSRSGLGGDWLSATALFLYAIPFSLAYVTLSTGTGALILFGAVQATMILSALWSGERPTLREWLGIGTGIVGPGEGVLNLSRLYRRSQPLSLAAAHR